MAGKIELLKNNYQAIFKFLSLLTITVALFKLADIFLNSELRLISAVTTEALLYSCGFLAERNFTVISVNGMAFDVIQSCSGSKSILIILILCVTATYIKSISLKGRIFLIALSIPAAILINSLRVFAIIIVSLLLKQPVEQGTIMHELIGIISFSISCLIFAFAAIKLSKYKVKTNLKVPLWTGTIVFLLCHVSFLNAGIRDWSGTNYNQDDIYSWVFFFAGLAGFVYLFVKSENKTDHFKIGSLIFSCSIIFSGIFQLSDINNYVQGLNFLLCIISIGIAQKGFNFVKNAKLPLLLCLSGFPRFSREIAEITDISTDYILTAKILLLLTVGIQLFKIKIDSQNFSTFTGSTSYIFYTSLICLSLQILSISGTKIQQPINVSFPYLIEKWNGFDTKITNKANVCRIFKKNNSKVGVLINTSANRKDIHTPEFCQFGQGWKQETKDIISFTQNEGRKITASVLKLQKNNQRRTFIYWFDNGHKSFHSYSGFISYDTLYKAISKNHTWSLYIVWTDDSQSSIKDFLKQIPPVRVKKVTKSSHNPNRRSTPTSI